MSLPIREILRRTGSIQLEAAIVRTADNLHVPANSVADDVAVAYVNRHFKTGQLEGWDGFVENIGG